MSAWFIHPVALLPFFFFLKYLKKYFLFLKYFFETLKLNAVEEEQDGIDIDGIGNLMDLPKLMFIDEECGNLKVVVDGG